MQHKIGGITFPGNITAHSTKGYSISGEDGKQKPLIGWEFKSPTMEGGIIFQIKSLRAAAKQAYEWFNERGMIDIAYATPTPTEWRLVAFIYPDEFFKGWGIDGDWKKQVRIASNTEKEHPNLRYSILKVGPTTFDIHTRMPYMDNAYLPEGITIEKFKEWHSDIKNAIDKPPLYREDFTDLGIWGND